jgi:putative phosphoesterase
MKIGVLSDIHGNHIALEEVLFEAQRQNVLKLYILGDIVGYYYNPGKVLEMLSNWDFEMIMGNHEALMLKMKTDSNIYSEVTNKYGNGHRIAINTLSSNQLEFINNLKDRLSINTDNTKFLLSHGCPWDNSEYIYPNTDESILKKFDEYEYDFILFGHSHYSFSFRTKHGIALNPGSVGQSREKGGKAYWSIINTSNRTFKQIITHYDTTSIKKEVMLYDPNFKYNLEILERN